MSAIGPRSPGSQQSAKSGRSGAELRDKPSAEMFECHFDD
jgi:hypothetical protein